MADVYILDTCNVLHASAEGRRWMRQNFEGAVEMLLQKARVLRDADGSELHLVVDGRGAKMDHIFPDKDSGLSIIYSPADLTADAIIERWVAKLKGYVSFCVFSNDLAVLQTALSYGGETGNVDKLFEMIRIAERSLSQKIETRRKDIDKAFNNPLIGLSNDRLEPHRKRGGKRGR